MFRFTIRDVWWLMVVVVAICLAVAIDRAMLASGASATKPDYRLMGEWIDSSDGGILSFRRDRTFNETNPVNAVAGITEELQPTMETRNQEIPGTYRWVSDNRIELTPLNGTPSELEVVIDGENLSLLGAKGFAWRGKRKP